MPTTPAYYSHPLFLPLLYTYYTHYQLIPTQSSLPTKSLLKSAVKKNTADFGKEMLVYFCLYYLNFFSVKSIYIYFLLNLRRLFLNLLTEFTLLIKYVNYGLFYAHKYNPVNFYRFRP